MTDELKSMLPTHISEINLNEQFDKQKAELEILKRKEFIKKQSIKN
jgi:hypothetical protein